MYVSYGNSEPPGRGDHTAPEAHLPKGPAVQTALLVEHPLLTEGETGKQPLGGVRLEPLPKLDGGQVRWQPHQEVDVLRHYYECMQVGAVVIGNPYDKACHLVAQLDSLEDRDEVQHR